MAGSLGVTSPDRTQLGAAFGSGNNGANQALPLTLNFGFPVLIKDGDERQLLSFSIGLGF